MQLNKDQTSKLRIATSAIVAAIGNGDLSNRDASEFVAAVASALRKSAAYLEDDNGILPDDEIRDLRECAEKMDDLVWEFSDHL